MGRTLLILLVAIGSGLLVYWLVAPRLLPASGAATPSSSNSPTASGNTGSPGGGSSSASANFPPIVPSGASATPNIAPIVSPEERAIQDYEAQRAPFYNKLRTEFADLVVDGRPAQDNRSTLVLYTTRSDDRIVTDILARIIQPYAYPYGFRHVRFFLPNPRSNVEHYRLDAEAQADEQGNWQAFHH